MSLPSWPFFCSKQAEIVSQVLLSNKVNYWTGNEGHYFEKEFSKKMGCDYAIAVSNGSVALEMALKALEVTAGDEVIVTPRSFFASASSVVNVGATPVFADIDPQTQNLSAESIQHVLGAKTKAIIVVHLAGLPAEMDEILELAKQKNLYVIEDCAQAHGAKYKEKSVGTIGDIGAWSFCQDKIMTTGGEGGMLTTSREDLWQKMWELKDHGKNFNTVFKKKHPPGFRWLHESFGSNYRMTEMQAALGRYQLTQLGEWVNIRRRHAAKLDQLALEFDFLRTLKIPEHSYYAPYKHYLFFEPEKLDFKTSRDDLISHLNQVGVSCFQGSCPEIYLEKAFQKKDFSPKMRLKNAKLLGETSLMFPVHPTIDDQTMDEICKNIKSVLETVT